MADQEHTTERTPLLRDSVEDGHQRKSSIFKRSWHTVSEMISPFSSSALASLPNPSALAQRSDGVTKRSVRTDNIPDVGGSGSRRDYQAINSLPPGVRVPKKIAGPIKVESKVWFANERTWVAYTNLGIMLGTLAIALFNSSKDNVSRSFGYAYGFISCVVIVYGYAVYQQRVTMIRRRDPGHFGQILGPLVISGLLFIAITGKLCHTIGALPGQPDQGPV